MTELEAAKTRMRAKLIELNEGEFMELSAAQTIEEAEAIFVRILKQRGDV